MRNLNVKRKTYAWFVADKTKDLTVPHQTFKSCLWPTCQQIICFVSDCPIKYTCETFNSLIGRAASHISTLWKIARHKTGLNILVNKQFTLYSKYQETYSLIVSHQTTGAVYQIFGPDKRLLICQSSRTMYTDLFGIPCCVLLSFKAVWEKTICAKLRTG